MSYHVFTVCVYHIILYKAVFLDLKELRDVLIST